MASVPVSVSADRRLDGDPTASAADEAAGSPTPVASPILPSPTDEPERAVPDHRASTDDGSMFLNEKCMMASLVSLVRAVCPDPRDPTSSSEGGPDSETKYYLPRGNHLYSTSLTVCVHDIHGGTQWDQW